MNLPPEKAERIMADIENYQGNFNNPDGVGDDEIGNIINVKI